MYHHSDTYTASNGFSNVGALWNHGNALALRASGLGIIRFETNTSMSTMERMRINADGNVGIGTTSPESKLQIKDGDIYLENSNTGVIMTSPNGQCWRMTVDNTGNPVFSNVLCPNNTTALSNPKTTPDLSREIEDNQENLIGYKISLSKDSNNTDLESKVKIYPNPTNNLLTLSLIHI